jgi:hypothetical protein
VVVRQHTHLPLGRGDQPRLGEPERRAPQSGHAFEIAVAVLVEDVHAFAAHDDERAFALELAQLRIRMQVVRDVAEPGSR